MGLLIVSVLSSCVFQSIFVTVTDADKMTMTKQPQTTQQAMEQAMYCNETWTKYGDSCYKVSTTSRTWKDSLSDCKSQKADLVSITNGGELAWVTSLLADSQGLGFWIGLHSSNITSFKWSDGSDLTILHWSSKMRRKTLYDDLDCVFIENQSEEDPGYWGISECRTIKPYVCKTKLMTKDFVATSAPTACGKGMINWLNKCYWLTDSAQDVSKSKQKCTENGGQLLNIGDVSELYFVSSLIYGKQKKFWTALHQNRTAGLLEWSNYEPLALSSRQLNMKYKSIKDGKCAYISYSGDSHYMSLANCSTRMQAVCERNEDGYTTAMPRPTLGYRQPSCPYDWNWSLSRQKCHWLSGSLQLSWDDAQLYCKRYGANLKDFRNRDAFYQQYRMLHEQIWLDIKLPDNNVTAARWGSDHTLVSDSDYPIVWENYKHLKSSCAYYCSGPSDISKRFCRAPCAARRSFACEIDTYKFKINKNIKIKTSSALVPCPDKRDNWFFFNGFCYYISTTDTPGMRTKNWKSANTFCKDNGADLISIHSDYDVDFVLKLVANKMKKPMKHVWIGLVKIDIGGNFNWTDGSPMNYLYWSNNHPNSYEAKSCASMSPLNGFWMDNTCNKQLYYICQRLPGGTSKSVVKDIPINGSCKPSWQPYGNKCFKIFDHNIPTYNYALETCRGFGPMYDLAAVGSQMENDFLRMLIKAPTLIGMISTDGGVSFYWTDNSIVTYSNLSPLKWSLRRMSNEVCVYLQTKTSKWVGERCLEHMGPFLCQGYKDPTLPVVEKKETCLRKNSYRYFNACYEFVYGDGNQRSWDNAQKYCEDTGGNLVSVINEEEQLFIIYTWRKFLDPHQPMYFWLGMIKEKNRLHWHDGWPIGYTYWDTHLNDSVRNKECLVIKSTNSRWNYQECNKLNNFICKITTDKVPEFPKTAKGTCPPGKGLEYIDIGTSYCYLLNDHEKWEVAELECKKYGGYLASIHSLEEAQNLALYAGTESGIWIGMFKDHKGTVKWVDGTPVDYMNFDDSHNFHMGDCVLLSTKKWNWNFVECYLRMKSVCAFKKIPSNETEIEDLHSAENESSKNSNIYLYACVAGAVIVCMILSTVLIHKFYKKNENKHGSLRTESDSSSFPNVLTEIRE